MKYVCISDHAAICSMIEAGLTEAEIKDFLMTAKQPTEGYFRAVDIPTRSKSK